MKRIGILFVLTTALTVTTAQAQVRFGVKGGVNLSNARFDDAADFKSKSVSGYYLGPTIEAMLGQGGLGVDVALLYSNKGFRFKSDEQNGNVKNSYIEVPANLKFKLGLPLVNPYVVAGPYIDFRVGGKETWEVIKAKSFGAGLNFGIGVQLVNALQIGLNYSLALTDNYSTFDAKNADSYKGKLWTGSLSAAYFF